MSLCLYPNPYGREPVVELTFITADLIKVLVDACVVPLWTVYVILTSVPLPGTPVPEKDADALGDVLFDKSKVALDKSKSAPDDSFDTT